MFSGLIIGFAFPYIGTGLEMIGIIFIRLVKSIIIPIIFAILVVGIAKQSDLKSLGRMGIKSLIYFEVITTAALFLSLIAANLTKPGLGVRLGNQSLVANSLGITRQMNIKEIIVHIFPDNFFEAASRGDIMEIVVFALIFATTVSLVGDKKKPIIEFCESLSEVMFKYTNIVMRFAPVGVGAAIAAVVASKGIHVLLRLCLLIATFYGTAIIFMVIILFPIALAFRVPVKEFLTAIKEPVLIAFSTSSSEAALPKAMENMEAPGVPRRVVSFVIPTGYSFNLDGTTLYLGLASIFVVQAAGMHENLTQQLALGFTLMLTSKGAAGVPRASLVILAGTLSSFGLPVEGVAVLLGIDTIMDMERTVINVTGNCLASVIIAKWEGVFRNQSTELEKLTSQDHVACSEGSSPSGLQETT